MVDGYEKVAEGAYCEVWFAPKALKTYQKASEDDRARMNRVLDHLSEQGYVDLTDTQFKTEGRFSSGGGKKVLVYAAKAYQLRLYGWFQQGDPRRFFCPEGAIKKDNKADQKQLKRVGKKAGE